MSGCYSLLVLVIPLITMKTIEIQSSTYELLQEIKKIFVDYTWEKLEEITDDRVIEVLANGFVESTDEDDEEPSHDHGHHTWGWCHHEDWEGCHHKGWEGCGCGKNKK